MYTALIYLYAHAYTYTLTLTHYTHIVTLIRTHYTHILYTHMYLHTTHIYVYTIESIREMELKNIKLSAQGKDQFMRRVFHEIKTPLHIFNGFTNDLFERIKTLTHTTTTNSTNNNNTGGNSNSNNNNNNNKGGIDEGMLEEMVGIQRNIDSILGTYSAIICMCSIFIYI